MWTLGYGHHDDRMPTHGYDATREAAMAAFAKSWRRERGHASVPPFDPPSRPENLVAFGKFPAPLPWKWACVAATNKYLAQRNKSRTQGQSD